MFECPMCGGPLLVLGFLGNRMHLTCRDCGCECSQMVDAETIADVEEVEDE
jgi:hypothetical protein